MANVIVIGGGAAGMMAALAASEKHSVSLYEKNEKLGKKLYITGKGRCNLTNATDAEGLIGAVCANPFFMYSSFYTFGSRDTMNFFENLGVSLKTERGNRVFPASDKSSDIIRALEGALRKNHISLHLNTSVKEIFAEDKIIRGVHLADGRFISADAVILATGGLSYPATGSTGDGYKMARSLGHKVTKLYPSLVPLMTKEDFVPELQGLSLKNVAVKLIANGKTLYSDFGEMLFTHNGVSGPLILSASRYATDRIGEDLRLIIDLKPALDENELDKRILRDFEQYKNKNFSNSLDELLPQKLIPVIVSLSGIDPQKKVNAVTGIERKKLRELLKALTLTVTATAGYNEAVITAGGIAVAEVDPATMRSKLIQGLYFAGELLDVDCFTGGFNLQAAFSTGYLAGTSIDNQGGAE